MQTTECALSQKKLSKANLLIPFLYNPERTVLKQFVSLV